MALAIALAALCLAGLAAGFYLPGVAPNNFDKKDPLQVKVNKLTSIKTQLPYSYVDSAQNLGEVLRGDRIENSPYTSLKCCQIVCKISVGEKEAKILKEKIEDEYRVNMQAIVPIKRMDQEGAYFYQHVFHVGAKGQYARSKDEKSFIHNHLSFTVKYHRDAQRDVSRIVAFEVKPYSYAACDLLNNVKHEYEGQWNDKKTRLTTCDPHAKHIITSSDSPQEVEVGKDIIFTYDVDFKLEIVQRVISSGHLAGWDTYLLMTDDQIHWFSIVNSLMIILFLSGMVAMIMLRTLYRDISKYNQLGTQEEAQEETGWKLVHGDLCVYVGTGVQFIGMLLVTMVFAVLGFLSPSNRGGLMTAMLLLWVFMGLLAGYSSSSLYKLFKGAEWKNIALRTAFTFPGSVFAIFFFLNSLIWGQKSSGAVPFTTMFALVLLWFGISVPLVFVGSFLGFKKPAIEDPVKTNKIPRQIPEQAWYMNPIFSILIGGILPFGAVFIELFILTSIWLHQFYYIFGEDYLWWWRSYLTSGSSAIYLFLYATFYFFTKLEITKFVSAVLYFGYMLTASYAFFALTGTIGFYACFLFTRLMYSSVKIE
ncbi:hypothetical protein DAI22_08g098100 [Oryza sativa Japonica Group]|nr:hypothetical protein DAI22_08g098100 [Oryza sativa Japonica Group]